VQEFRVRFVTCAIGLVLAVSNVADGQTTTGSIAGRVELSDGRPVAGALVEAVNRETGFSRTVRTDADGYFRVVLLSPGSYRLRGSFIGHAPQGIPELQVRLGATSVATLTLAPFAAQLERVTVAASAVPIVDDASLVTRVSRREIEGLPALGRNYADFVALSAAVGTSPEVTAGGRTSIAGQRASQTSLQVDGVDANNSFFGESRGGSRAPFNFSLESIREVQVVVGGYDVEHGRFAGGVINVITRGGANDFDATAFSSVRHRILTGPYFTPQIVGGDTISRPSGFAVVQYGASVSGPVVTDKLHYLVAIDGQRRREPFTPLTPGRFMQRGDTAAATAMSRFLSIIENRYGVAGAAGLYGPFLTTNDVLTVFGRIDYSLSETHRLTLRNNFAAFSNDNEAGSEAIGGGISSTEHIRNVSNSIVAELQSQLGERTFNVLRVQHSSEVRPRDARERRPELQVTLPGGDRVRFGGNHIAFRNRLDEQKVQLVNTLTHHHDSHVLKFGGGLLSTQVRNRFGGPLSAGVYVFRTLDDLDGQRPASYTRRMRADGSVPHYRLAAAEWSAWLQDEWRITPRLTTTIGFRYDAQDFRTSRREITELEQTFGVRTGIRPRMQGGVSPRISLAYDIRGDEGTVIRAGAGYFYGLLPLVIDGAAAITEEPVLVLTCRAGAPGSAVDPPSPSGYRAWDRLGADNPTACAAGGTVGGVPEYGLWGEQFHLPRTFRGSAGVAQRLGSRTLLSLDVLRMRSRFVYTVRDLNLRDAEFELAAEGGRRVFTPAAFFTPRTAAGQTRHRRSSSFANVLQAVSEGAADATLVTVELSQTVMDGTTLRAAYAYSRSYDNSSFSCCLLLDGLRSPRIGSFGPNDIGGRGDRERAWGPSDNDRPHTVVVALLTERVRGLRLASVWRIASGTPWTAEAGGDINGDGLNFNDRPFIFSPDALPLDPALPSAEQEAHRARYARYLDEYPCVGAYVGRIVPRNTCRNPAYNRLDASLGYEVPTYRRQRAELTFDLFNVLNLLNSNWGQYRGVTTMRRLLLEPRSFMTDADGPHAGRVTYAVPTTFGERQELGINLMLQWQAQVAVRYRF
jgi:hypothetical protein